MEIQNHATLIKIQAERWAGELLAAIERSAGGGHMRSTASLAVVLRQNDIPETTGRRWQVMARLPESRLREIAAHATDVRQELTSIRIYQEALSHINVRKPTPAMPDGVFRVLYVDAPWPYNGGRPFNYGPVTRHYSTLMIEDICELKLPAIERDAALFLWVPVPHLENGLRVCAASGFTYKTHFVWNKQRHNFGSYVSVRHELLLLATRGRCLPDGVHTGQGGVERKLLIPSIQSIERTSEHSRKPEEFRRIIDKMYTHGHRIELFARGPLPEGWDGWGDEFQDRHAVPARSKA